MGKFLDSDNSKQSMCIKPEIISLNDCLACSGCITSAESAEFNSDVSFVKDSSLTLSFIISIQSKINLKQSYPEISYECFQKNLVKFLKETFNVLLIVDTSYFRKSALSGLSSECPAVVLYIERVYPDLIKKLSTHKTFQQMASSFILESTNNTDQKIVSVMQCYDKKDEINRDKTKIDYFVGAKEFYNLIKDKFNPIENLQYELQPWERSYEQKIDEISGLENCINIFNKAKSHDVGSLELRICKGGCYSGPALVQIQEQLPITLNEESSYQFETLPRKFNIPKKRKFDVHW